MSATSDPAAGAAAAGPGFEELLRRLPKAELHCHLEGAVPAHTFVELARKNDVPLRTYDPDEIYRLEFGSLEAFLEVYYQVCRSLQDRDDFGRATYESLVEAADRGNLRYRELFFNPSNHPALPYREQLAGVLDGMRRAEEDRGVVCRLIPAINREHSPAIAEALVDEVLAHRCDEVLGIGLDHNELAGPPERFVEAYRRAAAGGLRRTAHAGERGSVAEVADSVDLLGCERIDHGYATVQDPSLAARCREQGLHFTACWTTSTLWHGADPATTPLRRMVDEGLSVSLNSDDPPLFGTDIGAEYVGAATTLGWQAEQAVARTLAAVDAAWLDDGERSALRRRFEAEIAELRAG